MAMYKNEGRSLVFCDESGFSHDMPRTHGYAQRGKRCFGIHNWGEKGRTNAIGALLGKTLLTVMLIFGTVNTAVFNAWVAQDLLPKLPPNSVVIMDNAAFHKGKDLRPLLEKEGHTLEYQPPYSPDLNPIEHKWAQEKKRRRKTKCSIDDLFQNEKI